MTKDLICIEDVKKATRVLRAVNHSLRQKILQLLHKNKQLTVAEIYERLDIEQSVCSTHLGILRKEGIVVPIRFGKMRYYSIVGARLNDINTYSFYLASKEPKIL